MLPAESAEESTFTVTEGYGAIVIDAVTFTVVFDVPPANTEAAIFTV